MKKINYELLNDIEATKFTIDDDGKQQIVGELWFQHGPINENGVNGVQINDVISMLVKRLKYLNQRFPSKYNQSTIEHLIAAEKAQNDRTEDRENRGVEGSEKL